MDTDKGLAAENALGGTCMHDTADFMADIYGLGTGPWTMTPVTRGALGQIWKLAGNGSSWAVKELLFGCDKQQVQREAALRNATERMGIVSPRLIPNRDGDYVSRLPPSLGGSYTKLYDWVNGTEADASDPEILSWFGRTLALLHMAGEGATAIPDSWYEECHQDADWTELHQEIRQAALPWSDALGRFVSTSAAELKRHVTTSDPGGLVTSHLDLQPQNVLVGPAGPVLLDWDNAGSTSAERELARAVFVWSGGNQFNTDSARRVARGYVDAGGRATIKSLDSFSMLFATALNYLYVQAECAIDPTVTAAQREFASGQVVASLRNMPDLTAASRLIKALEAEW